MTCPPLPGAEMRPELLYKGKQGSPCSIARKVRALVRCPGPLSPQEARIMRTRLCVVGVLAGALGMPAAALPQAKRPAVDLQGNPLPAGAVARLGTVSFYHE